jgi:hypothetical protein
VQNPKKQCSAEPEGRRVEKSEVEEKERDQKVHKTRGQTRVETKASQKGSRRIV